MAPVRLAALLLLALAPAYAGGRAPVAVHERAPLSRSADVRIVAPASLPLSGLQTGPAVSFQAQQAGLGAAGKAVPAERAEQAAKEQGAEHGQLLEALGEGLRPLQGRPLENVSTGELTEATEKVWTGRRRYSGDLLLDTLNPFALALNKLAGVSHAKLAPYDKLRPKKGEVIVGLNAVHHGERYQKAADQMTGHAIPGVVQRRVGDQYELLGELRAAYREHGPISRLILAAHGSPGGMSIGGYTLDGKWARRHYPELRSLPPDLFRDGAEIILISCSVAMGMHFDRTYGIDSLKAVFGPMLKKGGRIIASNRYVDPELSLLSPEYITFGDRVVRHLMAPLILIVELMLWMLADWRSKFTKIVRIDVPPSA